MSGPSIGATLLFVSSDEGTWKREAELAQLLDIGHVELRLEYPAGNAKLSERQLRMIKNLLRGFSITMHAPNFPLITPHKALRQLAINELTKTLEIAAGFESKLLTIHGGVLPHAPWRQEIDIKSLFEESVRVLLEAAKKFDQALAIENVPKGSGSRRHYPATTGEISEATANNDLKVTLDVGHAIENQEDPALALQRLGPKVMNIHLHDYLPEGGSHKELGTGILALEPIVAQLHAQSYTGFLTLELYEAADKKAGMERSLARLRSLLRTRCAEGILKRHGRDGFNGAADLGVPRAP